MYILYSAQPLGGVQLCVTPWTVTRQAPLSIGLFRQEYWNWLPFPTPGDLPDPGIKPVFLASPALADGLYPVPPGKPHIFYIQIYIFFSGYFLYIMYITESLCYIPDI